MSNPAGTGLCYWRERFDLGDYGRMARLLDTKERVDYAVVVERARLCAKHCPPPLEAAKHLRKE